ncbi:MAG: ATP-binding protein [Acidimicrobiia bacterium]
MPGTPQRIDDFSLTCPAEVGAIADVRADFTAWLRRWVVDEETISDMTVVLSELLANAVSAAEGTGRTVHVLACAEDSEVVVAVQNPTVRWVDDRWDLDDPLRLGGRGLLIVRTLVDELEVDRDERAGTTTVRSRKAVPVGG